MAYVIVPSFVLIVGFVAFVFLTATGYFIIEQGKQRIRELSRSAQHAELHTGIPYYTGSGAPISHELECSNYIYNRLHQKLQATMSQAR